MKKTIAVFFVLFLLLCTGSHAEASEPVRIKVNGAVLMPDVAPVVIDGRTLVPVRFVAEALGVNVNWDEKTKTVMIGSGLTPDVPTPNEENEVRLFVNGQLLSPDVPPRLVNDRVMVPIRFIAEALRCRVGWYERQNTVTVTDIKYTTMHANILPANGMKQDDIDRIKEHVENAYLEASSDSSPLLGKFCDIYVYPDHASFVNGLVELRKMPREEAEKLTYFWGTPNIIGIDLSNFDPEDHSFLVRAFSEFSARDTARPGRHQWQSFDTEYFQVYYYQDEAYVTQVSQKFDEIYRFIVNHFGHKPSLATTGKGLIPVYFFAQEDFRDFHAGQWITFTRSINLNLYLKIYDDSNFIYEVFRHELTHGVTFGSSDRKAKNIPLWFIEGVACYHENENPSGGAKSYEPRMVKAVRENGILSWDGMSKNSFKWGVSDEELCYAQSWSVWEYLAKTYGEQKMNSIFYTGGDFKEVITGVTLKNLGNYSAT